MRCSNVECGHVFSTLHGTDIPVVLPGATDSFLALDAPVDFCDANDIDAWIATLVPGSAEWELALRTGMYAVSHYEENQSLASRLYERFVRDLPVQPRWIADVGCGVGGFGYEIASRSECDVVGLDASGVALRVAMAAWSGREMIIPELRLGTQLRARRLMMPPAPRRGRMSWLCADIHNPPLMAEAFDLVVAVNLIDSTPEPLVALGQAAAMVRPGGHLLLAQPDAWNTQATPASEWLASKDDTWDGLLAEYGLETVDRDDGFDWELTRTPRYRFRYVSHARLARRIIPTN
jgi:SAM-dependent methyltransferase